MPKLAGAIRRSWRTAQRLRRLVYRNQCPNLYFLPWNFSSPSHTIQVSKGGEDLLGDPVRCVRKQHLCSCCASRKPRVLAFAVLRAEPRVLHVLDRPSTTELQTQPNSNHLWFSVSISSTPTYMFRTYLRKKTIASVCGLPGLFLKIPDWEGQTTAFPFLIVLDSGCQSRWRQDWCFLRSSFVTVSHKIISACVSVSKSFLI